MKILWVCNIMLPIIAEKLGVEGSNKEGWLSGLCDSILEHRHENQIELHVAYPVMEQVAGAESYEYHRIELSGYGENAVVHGYGFYEDVAHAEKYDDGLERSLAGIIKQAEPDVIHCFGTEYAHTLAVARCCEQPERVLVGIQGLCDVIAKAYMADLPEEVQKKVTFRDWLKQDSIKQQQQKFVLRGEREKEIVRRVGNVTGRTRFDRYYVEKWNPKVNYYNLNETLRSCFYEGEWTRENCEPHTIFVSQGDYPLKGLHYLLRAAGELQKQYPDIQIKIAGNSLVCYQTLKDKLKISAYGRYLRKLIKDQCLEGKVEFLGRLTAEEMKEQYIKSGLYICCSTNENSPNSLGEAMLLGVPCVAANVGGISSIFTHGEDGILYEGFELEEMKNYANIQKKETFATIASLEENNMCNLKESAQCHVDETNGENGKNRLNTTVFNLQNAIKYMWDNPDLAEKYCKNARKHARKTHDKNENYQKMTEIYAEINNRPSESINKPSHG